MKIKDLFGKRVPTKIILFFLDNPSKKYIQSQIIRILGISKGSASKWLKELVNFGILKKNEKFELNRENPLVKQMKILNTISKIYPYLKNIDVEIYLFGSHALGEDDEKSDLDLLVMCRESPEIIKKINQIEKKLNKKIHLVFHSYVEWSKIAREDPAFYEMVEKSKIKVN